MKYFKGITNLNDLKNMFRELAKTLHPDLNPSLDGSEFQELNNEYEMLRNNFLRNGEKFTQEHFNSEVEIDKILFDLFIKLQYLEGVDFEVIGNWLWATGDTKTHKEILKENGFKFAPVKKAWFFKTYNYYKKTKETTDFQDMRALWGSKIMEKEEKNNNKPIFAIN